MDLEFLITEFDENGEPFRDFIEVHTIVDDDGCYYYADEDELILSPTARVSLEAIFRDLNQRFPSGDSDPYSIEMLSVDGIWPQYL